jgi:hypothetical protein
MEVKKLDKQSAAVFTKLLKEKSYAHFEARSVLLGLSSFFHLHG